MSPGSPVGVAEPKEQESRTATGRLAVCHIVSGDRWAGAEVQVATLLRAMARRSELQVNAIVLNEGRLADELRIAGVEVFIIPESSNNFFQIYRKAAKLLQHRHIDILHSHRYKEDLLAVLLGWRLGIRRLVRTQHGLPEPFHGFASLKQGAIRAVVRATTGKQTRLICVSNEMLPKLALHYRPSTLVMIHNGIDLESVRSDLTISEAKRQLGVDPTRQVVGALARLEPIKRIDLFLESARIVVQSCPSTVFITGGTGSEEPRLRQLAESLGIGGQVLFLGHYDGAYVALRAMDVMVMTSDHEGMPMALLEAMALGTPVVARAVGGIREVIEDGASGLLVADGEAAALAAAVVRVLTDKGLADTFRHRGPERIRMGFDAAKTARDTLRLYLKMRGTQ